MNLHFVIAEAALELVPQALWREAAVRRDAERRRTEPGNLLLDRSVHHFAMGRLPQGYRRGRPDLVHLTLLSVTSTPLHLEGMVRVYLHTVGDTVIEFGRGVRPPKSYDRFRGLMEKVLIERPSRGLVAVRDAPLAELLRSVGTDYTVGLSVQGEPRRLDDVAAELTRRRDPAVVVGGFPAGHFAPDDLGAFDRLIRIDRRALDAHVVAARVVYEVEKAAEAAQ